LKTYIVGKITGLHNYKELFDKAENKLKDEGNLVMNPSVLPDGFEYDLYLPICYKMIDACDCVFMLSNWVDSKGAKLEFEYALNNGKIIIFQKLLDKITLISILEKGLLTLEIYQQILNYYYREGHETDHFGGGGVDIKGLYHLYITNYKKDNALEYKVYEQ